MTTKSSVKRRRVSLSAQQRAVLDALRQQSPLPTTTLYDVRVPYVVCHGSQPPVRRSYRVGEPVGAVLRRLEKRGLVTGEMDSQCKDWWITDDGLEAIGWTRGPIGV